MKSRTCRVGTLVLAAAALTLGAAGTAGASTMPVPGVTAQQCQQWQQQNEQFAQQIQEWTQLWGDYPGWSETIPLLWQQYDQMNQQFHNLGCQG